MKNNKHYKNLSVVLKSRRGSTLLMAILIVAVIVSSTFIVGRISLRNINQMRILVDGEKIILAAESGLEQGLWAHTRDKDAYVGNCDDGITYNTDTLTNPEISSKNCRSFLHSSPFPMTFTDDTDIYLINPSDPQGGAKYTSISFTHISGRANVKLCNWNVVDCSNGAGTRWNNHSSGTITIPNLDPSQKYIIFINVVGNNDYQILASGVDNNSASRGLPAEYVTVEGRGEHARNPNTRSVQIKVVP